MNRPHLPTADELKVTPKKTPASLLSVPSFKRLIPVLAGLVILVLVGGAALGGWQVWQNLQDTSGEQEVAQVLSKVSTLMELPEGTPTLATVTDKTKLQNQTFFQKAENGDKVLIYVADKRAILYRPSTNKIVDVAPIQMTSDGGTVNVSGTSGDTSGAPQASPTALPIVVLNSRIALYNGTTKTGLTLRAQTYLEERVDATFSTRENAVNRSYPTTVVVDVNGSQAGEAQQLAGLLNASVGELPAGEATPSSDIAIYIGNDFQP